MGRELVVEARILKHDAKGTAYEERFAHRIVPGDAKPACGRREDGRQHLDSGRLARAVRTEKCENDVLCHGEGDAVNHGEAVKILTRSRASIAAVINHFPYVLRC